MENLVAGINGGLHMLDMMQYTIAEMKAMCDSRGIDIPRGAKKLDIAALLSSSIPPAVDGGVDEESALLPEPVEEPARPVRGEVSPRIGGRPIVLVPRFRKRGTGKIVEAPETSARYQRLTANRHWERI